MKITRSFIAVAISPKLVSAARRAVGMGERRDRTKKIDVRRLRVVIIASSDFGESICVAEPVRKYHVRARPLSKAVVAWITALGFGDDLPVFLPFSALTAQSKPKMESA
jgi:hypothetical protein